MPSLIISSASRSSPRIFIYHSSHIILIPSSFHSIILAFFTFPLIHFTMVLFAISSKLIFTLFIFHTLLFIIPSSFPSFFNSITLITTHPCFSFSIASMFSIHSYSSIPIPFFLSITSITLTHIHFHSNTLIPFHHSHIFSVVFIGNTLGQLDDLAFISDDWFESSGIEWWGNGRMNTWGLKGKGVVEALRIEVNSIGW